MKQLLHSISLDKAVSITGAIALLISIFLILHNGFHSAYLAAAIIGLVCICAYFIVAHKWTKLPEYPKKSSTWIPIAIAFAFCIASWIVFLLRPESSVKPILYYVLVSIATGAAIYGALHNENRKLIYLTIGLACIIGLSHIYTEHLLFPSSLIGVDPWTHQSKTMEPVLLGSLGGRLSLMHPYLKHIMELFSINYKWASVTFVGAVNVTAVVLLSFLIGKKLYSPKVGCIASLMVANANWMVFFGEWVIPNTIGASLGLLTVYLVTKIHKDRWLLPTMSLIITLAYLTHILIAVWIVMTLFCLRVIPALLSTHRIQNKPSYLIRSSAPLLLVIAIPMLLLCTTVMGDSLKRTMLRVTSEPSFGATIVTVQPTIVLQTPTQAEAVVESPIISVLGTNMAWEVIVASLGMLLYVGIAIIGCLAMLRKEATLSHKSFAILSLVVLATGFIPRLFGIYLLDQRWWYFAMALLAVPLGLSLVQLASTSYIRQGVIIALATAIVFLSTNGLASNMTNRTLFPDITVRYAFTNTEIASLGKIIEHDEAVVGTDPLFALPARRIINSKVLSLESELLSGNFSNSTADILLLRSALNEEPIGLGDGTIYRLSYDIVATAEEQGFQKVWSNKEVTCLIRK